MPADKVADVLKTSHDGGLVQMPRKEFDALVRKAALAGGMKSLLSDGRLKILNGTTTAEEIVKVAQVEGITTG